MLTLIMPVHNQRIDYFKRACYSALSQTKPLLLHIVDDCSNEDYSINYKKFCEMHKIGYSRISKNIGPGLARQWGIDNGYLKADYISFIDSDDILVPQFCDILTSEISKTGADYISANMVREGNSRITDRKIKETDSITWLHGKIYSRKFLKENNIHFHKNIWFNEDVYFNTKAAYWSNNHGMVDKTVYIWFNNKDSVTRNIDYVSWYKQHNIGYFLSQVYVLEEILKTHHPVDIGVLFAQLYNSYQTELIFRPESKENLDLIIYHHFKNISSLVWEEYFKKEGFFYRASNRIGNSFEKNFFLESFLSWRDHIMEVLINGIDKHDFTMYRNYFGKGGAWERYSGEYDDFPL